MQIANFLDPLGLGEDVEVVVTNLPERAWDGLLADGEFDRLNCFA